ncbi:hypothetical protein COZ78_03275 [bacterium (Candidatus Gribaldobacteria) CG_4_8_14_3_um_filter_42_11]|uniref:Uncharacterized protein n=1 Tax=bacterium (Candidatus Gribaldobacteria) CG_4_8_14_3_um_filter_42_11 TaxID=2014267 RepID=A0A2M7IXR4_9BACT|nr:MAG: hypothetical protein AUJ36_00280 [Parcubacteria group bacterium CG1_02_41_26]PIX02896.1 MAG: hypothetical protein COZ78_03275 [bacterium (Candidatus Gribaldobacteria) CG_4_8_14_3_um_filter_42_11]
MRSVLLTNQPKKIKTNLIIPATRLVRKLLGNLLKELPSNFLHKSYFTINLGVAINKKWTYPALILQNEQQRSATPNEGCGYSPAALRLDYPFPKIFRD